MCMKWMHDSEQKFQSALSNKAIQNKVKILSDNCYEKNEQGVNACFSDLTDIIFSAAKVSLKRGTHKKKKGSISKDKLSFDSECRMMKNKVLSLANIVKRFPGDPIVYGNFVTKKSSRNS